MSKGTILVVEDDVRLLEGIQEILELEKFAVTTACNGLEGLERLTEMTEPPDLIVSDIMMPKMDGYMFVKAVQAQPQWAMIPFIFLTAKDKDSDIRVAKRRYFIDDYITKPFSIEDLLVAVDARLRRARQWSAVQVSEMNELKRNILTILNHEFRTPLTYVVAYADMLSGTPDCLSGEYRSFLQGIQSGAVRLRRLIENFIFLVEVEVGEMQNTFERRKRVDNDFRELCKSLADNNEEFAEEKNVTFVIDVPDAMPCVEMDHEYFVRGLNHLVENAIKFTKPEGGTITLKAEAEDGRVILSISDEGRGIPPEELKHIFESFYQVNREQYEDQGAGSGLAIVKGIVTVHGGTIRVESEFGKGSAFIITLPVVESD